ncbi:MULTISPECIES: glycosyltransferase family 2 protein [Moorena]|uniref:Glycosyltransferase family 2 protein n=1 Tax=Moorena producens (strain JHB) TaxID=1454205 RepID=A0A1D9GA41_MOOP1|nr:MULTISPECIES: glycosyltransferase family 2 protein [Moorena]AOY84335.1 glycosyltransferase family 2 protein [Moorena producens JHB]NEQ04530.1 glycosyltransferase family 2 protein [Moorena sp. SIO4E2]NES44422.1 glycosyltransferase family 2 protein [Moorena sp. SIO2C4]
MKLSVLINNYNYQHYVSDAIDSVLQQSFPVDEIIVVDDKSTDKSAQILHKNFAANEKVKLVLKDKNEGQLSSFNAGFIASCGDIICFLDADDLYKENYIAEVVKFYQEHPECDFLFCSAEVFGNEERIASCYNNTRDLGYSRIATLYKKAWVGHRTSTVSMRRHVLEKFLPLPQQEDWRIRADDCLVFGASIVGARKFYLAKPLVRYRAHGNNNHYGQKQKRTPEYLDKYKQAVDHLLGFLAEKMSYPSNLYEQAHIEFRTIPKPNEQEFNIYESIIDKSELLVLNKLSRFLSIYIHFISRGGFLSLVRIKLLWLRNKIQRFALRLYRLPQSKTNTTA